MKDVIKELGMIKEYSLWKSSLQQNKRKVKTSNQICGTYVDKKIPFVANNIFSENKGNFYVVYSYDRHYPMYIYDRVKKLWYGNKDRYSRTTQKHLTQAHPHNIVSYIGTKDMISILESL